MELEGVEPPPAPKEATAAATNLNLHNDFVCYTSIELEAPPICFLACLVEGSWVTTKPEQPVPPSS